MQRRSYQAEKLGRGLEERALQDGAVLGACHLHGKGWIHFADIAMKKEVELQLLVDRVELEILPQSTKGQASPVTPPPFSQRPWAGVCPGIQARTLAMPIWLTERSQNARPRRVSPSPAVSGSQEVLSEVRESREPDKELEPASVIMASDCSLELPASLLRPPRRRPAKRALRALADFSLPMMPAPDAT
jgi:hypothetical protein